MSYIAKLTSKGQITIPQEIRRRLGIRQGDQVSFEFEENGVVIKPYRSEDNLFLKYQGALGGFNTVEEINTWLADMRDEE